MGYMKKYLKAKPKVIEIGSIGTFVGLQNCLMYFD